MIIHKYLTSQILFPYLGKENDHICLGKWSKVKTTVLNPWWLPSKRQMWCSVYAMPCPPGTGWTERPTGEKALLRGSLLYTSLPSDFSPLGWNFVKIQTSWVDSLQLWEEVKFRELSQTYPFLPKETSRTGFCGDKSLRYVHVRLFSWPSSPPLCDCAVECVKRTSNLSQ